MKLVQISDIHINADPIAGGDSVKCFEECIAHVATHHGNSDAVVITGDLTHHGRREAYEKLRQILDASPLKPLLMIGNHDHRETFCEFFPEVETDEHGHVQYVRDIGGNRLIFLDTNIVANHSGRLGPRRQAWLSTQLTKAAADKMPVLLFMHHNPINTGILAIDILGLVQKKEFSAILKAHPGVVKHLFFGHCHMILSGSIDGVPFSAAQSTSHPSWPHFDGRLAYGHGPIQPSYTVALIEPSRVMIHNIEYRLEGEIEWEPLTGGAAGTVTVPPGA